MQASSGPSPFSRWRGALDTAATLLLIAVCVGLLWAIFFDRRIILTSPPAAAPQKQAQRNAAPKLPTDAVALDGAELRGSKTAHAVMIEYSDFQCPYCGRFARETLPEVVASYVDNGKLLLAFREMPLESIHQFALKASEAAFCGGKQGAFWKMHDSFFGDQKQLGDDAIFARVKSLGLDKAAFEDCLSKEATKKKIQDDIKTGEVLAVTGTPTFFLGVLQADGKVKVVKRLSGAPQIAQLKTELDVVIRDASTSVNAR